jgi:hypothetical protein
MNTFADFFKTLAARAIANPRSTITGASALAVLFFPEHSGKILAVSVALQGAVSADAADAKPSATETPVNPATEVK